MRDKGKLVHLFFDVSLAAKAVDGALEIVGGVLLLLVDPRQMGRLAQVLTRGELAEDPRDFIAGHLLSAARHLSAGTQAFAAIFLLWHGAVKVALVWALLRRHLWAYPIATGAFALFLAYQLYRYAHTRSAWLLVLSALDVFVIVITWLEYRRLRAAAGSG